MFILERQTDVNGLFVGSLHSPKGTCNLLGFGAWEKILKHFEGSKVPRCQDSMGANNIGSEMKLRLT